MEVPKRYYADVRGAGFPNMFTGNLDKDVYNQFAKISTKTVWIGSNRFDQIQRFEGHSSNNSMALLIHRDDGDWKFIFSGTDLTTALDAREYRILAPQAGVTGVTFEPKAATWFLTGECLLSTGQ